MTLLFGALFAGLLAGMLLRGRRQIVKLTKGAVMVAVFMLLFLLGLSVGANEAITSNLGRLGIEALVLSLAGTTGSVALVFVLYRGFSR